MRVPKINLSFLQELPRFLTRSTARKESRPHKKVSSPKKATTKAPKRTDYEVLSSASPLAIDSVRGKRRILLAGELVNTSLSPASAQSQGHMALPPITALDFWHAVIANRAPHLYLSVPQNLVSMRSRFAVAPAGYLQWGLKLRHDCILLGGAESGDQLSVDVMVFANRRLIAVDQRYLPLPAAMTFDDAVAALVGDLRTQYRSSSEHLYVAAPLPEQVAQQDAIWIDTDPLRSLVFRPLTSSRTGVSHGWRAIFGAGMLGLSCFALGTGLSWMKYRDAVSAFDAARAFSAFQDGSIDESRLAVLEARKELLTSRRSEKAMLEAIERVAKAIASDGRIKISSVQAPASAGSAIGNEEAVRDRSLKEREPDIQVVVSSPLLPVSGIEQATGVLAALSKSTGLSLRLAQGGVRESDGQRFFTIEGFLHD